MFSLSRCISPCCLLLYARLSATRADGALSASSHSPFPSVSPSPLVSHSFLLSLSSLVPLSLSVPCCCVAAVVLCYLIDGFARLFSRLTATHHTRRDDGTRTDTEGTHEQRHNVGDSGRGDNSGRRVGEERERGNSGTEQKKSRAAAREGNNKQHTHRTRHRLVEAKQNRANIEIVFIFILFLKKNKN